MIIASEKELMGSVSSTLPRVNRALVLAPHPDDEVFGCGGTLCLLKNAGVEVSQLVLTNGALGGGNNPEDLTIIRQEESLAAAGVLGLSEPMFWKMPDRSLNYGELLIGNLMSAIEESGAELVFLPAPTEIHPDHQALSFAGAEALRRLGGTRQAAFYELNTPLADPNLILDISLVVNKKQQAMECFRSQLAEQPYDIRISGLNSYRAFFLGQQAVGAEAFLLASASELGKTLPEIFSGAPLSRRRQGFAICGSDLPLVSIIIRSIDRLTLAEALDSVALQTWPNIEVLVVNAKGEKHRDLGDHCGRFPLRMIETGERLRRSRAGNVGLNNARGDYLIFLDDDDWFMPEHISLLVDALMCNPDKKVAYSCVTTVNEQKQSIGNNFCRAFDRTRLLAGNYIPIHAVLFSQSLVDESCRMDESLDLYEDWDFWLQAAALGDFLFVPHFSAYYRIGGLHGSGIKPDVMLSQQVRVNLLGKWRNEWRPDDLLNIMDRIGEFDTVLADHDTVLADRDTVLADHGEQIAALNQSVAERVEQIAALNQSVADRGEQITALNQSVAERGEQITTLNQSVAERDKQIVALYSSNSWRVTRPLRILIRLMRGEFGQIFSLLRRRFIHYGRRLYWRIPMQHRDQILHWAYCNLGPLFKGLPHYEQWNCAVSYSNTNSGDTEDTEDTENIQLLLIDRLPQARQAEGNIAIHLHIYYDDLTDEFSGYLKNMPFEYDLYVSVAKKESIEICQKSFSGLEMKRKLVIEQVPNQGRDIAPMFCTFGSQLKNYCYIAHMHSKKSLYNNGATDGWRQYLCSNLLGSKERIRRIFALMQGESSLGIIYPQNYMLLPFQANTWLANKCAGTAWCARLGISKVPQGYFDFPAGTMFWAKGDALKPLMDAGISLDDFSEEDGQMDGTFAHCLERLLVLSSLKQGYKPGIIKDLLHPSWSAWGIQQYTSRPFQYMADQLADPPVKLVAFDIFDTLLSRPLLSSESVKVIVAERLGGKNGQIYLQYRPIAESQARLSAGKDIGMTEIFAQLGKMTTLSDVVLGQLRAMEEKIEQATLKPRREAVELYRLALATGKPVILISDMFLPAEVIEKILLDNGISGWNKLFLSSEIGKRKDTGELYEYVFNHYGINPGEMLMIGDNEHSDIQIPGDKGVTCLHALKPLELARALPRFHSLIEKNEGACNLNRELTLGLVVQQNFSALSYPRLDPSSLVDPTPYNIGYSLIGPLLVGLSQWILESARRDGINRLYFLAREGQLIKNVYDQWTEGFANLPKAEYLCLSRRTVSVPMIQNIEDILSIAKCTYYLNTIDNFLYERYGLQLSDERWNQLADKVQWSSKKTVEVYDQNLEHLLPLLNELEKDIITVAHLEYDSLKHYLVGMGLEKQGNQAVVDVGYGATIQNYLNQMVSVPVHGYYMITDERSVTVTQKHNVHAHGCYFENINRASTLLPPMYRDSFKLEKFLSSNDPQIVRYELDHDKNITSHYRVLSNDERNSSSFRMELQQGVISFAGDARSVRENILPGYRPSCTIANQLYEAFLAKQSKVEMNMLREIALDDHYCGRGVVR